MLPHRRASSEFFGRVSALVLIAALTACGSDSPGTGPDDDPVPDPDPVDSEPTLECGLPDYPCAWSGVPSAIVERTLALRDEAVVRLDGGADPAEVEQWLEGLDDVAEAQSHAVALRYRVVGGRGVWIYLDGALQSGPNPDASGRRGLAAGTAPPARHVVGDVPEKRALVLSPQLWEFGEEWTDATEVAAILAATRGYDGRVDLRANAEETSTDVGPEAFRDWDQYDVIHYNGHGLRVCDLSGCRATLFLGLLDNFLPGDASETAKILQLDEMGYELALGKRSGSKYVLIGADFFREHYPGGLDETLVFLNSCQTVGPAAVDLALALAGTTSAVLGWSDSVYADDGMAASLALWDYLSDQGYPARVALEKIGDLRTGAATHSGDGTPPVLTLIGRPDGDDLHIREVVTVLNPDTGDDLDDSPSVRIVGDAGDGQPDQAPFRVRVEGILDDYAGSMDVFVTVDGVDADPIRLSNGTKDDRDAWIVDGVVQLPYDLTDDRSVVVRARVALHSGGESTDESTAVLTGRTPIMGYEWELVGSHRTYWTGPIPHTPYHASSVLTLEFAPGQDPDEPNPEYVLTGGTVTWDYSHTYYSCVFSSPAVTFEVTPEIAVNSSLVFDTSVQPARYSGWVRTFGPMIEITESCGESTGTRLHRAYNVWVELDASEAKPVSADGTTITGTHLDGTQFPGYAFVLESTYTIRRVR